MPFTLFRDRNSTVATPTSYQQKRENEGEEDERTEDEEEEEGHKRNFSIPAWRILKRQAVYRSVLAQAWHKTVADTSQGTAPSETTTNV